MLAELIDISYAPALSPKGLRPVIHPKDWVDSRPRSEDGFSDELATLALSPSLRLGLQCDGLNLSQRGLDSLGLSIHTAWDFSAINLERAARTPAGIEFSTRCASTLLGVDAPPGLEVKVRGADISCWLAHPQTFSILHRHLLRITRAQTLVYVLTKKQSLLAFIDVPAQAVSIIAASLRGPARFPLLWAHGFPQEYRGTSCINN